MPDRRGYLPEKIRSDICAGALPFRQNLVEAFLRVKNPLQRFARRIQFGPPDKQRRISSVNVADHPVDMPVRLGQEQGLYARLAFIERLETGYEIIDGRLDTLHIQLQCPYLLFSALTLQRHDLAESIFPDRHNLSLRRGLETVDELDRRRNGSKMLGTDLLIDINQVVDRAGSRRIAVNWDLVFGRYLANPGCNFVDALCNTNRRFLALGIHFSATA